MTSCVYCAATFTPRPARRIVCPSCVARRNKQIWQAKHPKPEKPKRPRVDYAELDRLKLNEIAQRSYQAAVDEEWRQRNVIQFRVPHPRLDDDGGMNPMAA